MSVSRASRVIEYPHSDGKPMAESAEHLEAMIYLTTALQAYFDKRDDVYVAGNQFMYWVEGNPAQRVAPDVYVVFGVPKYPPRPTWKVWEEGKAPDVIFELSSRPTAGEDLYRKYRLYQRLGVKEYILIDVTREYLAQPVFLYRLAAREYVLIANERPNDREWWAHSEQLGLRIMLRGEDRGYLTRLWDPAAQIFLPSPHEAAEGFLSLWDRLQEAQYRAEEEARRAEEEARARAELERRLREMEAELKRLKGGDSSSKA